MPPETVPPESTAQYQQRVRAARAVHWRRTRRLTVILMTLWLTTGFCTVFFARELAGVTVFGWPLSFYMAAQGASLVCLAILGAYAWRMRTYDSRYARLLAHAEAGASGKKAEDTPGDRP